MRKLTFVFLSLGVGCTVQKQILPPETSSGGPAQPRKVETTAARRSFSPTCPEEMVRVTGDYCPQVEQVCLRWLDKDTSPSANGGIGPMRCAEFREPTKCLSPKRIHKSFCIDLYEAPNVKGIVPPIDISWYQAKAGCEAQGKRLCGDSEWTLACEGPEMHPYPYGDGYHRDEDICDQRHESMDPSLPRSQWSRFNHAHPSGAFPGCVSPFGVYDMTGNVDEWVVNESGKPYVSGLKGGYWTYKVRTRCRPMTTVHGPEHSFYQNAYRCCKD